MSYPGDFHTQDWLLITEALIDWAGNPREVDTSREERAWTLIDVITDAEDIHPSEVGRQIDRDWKGEKSPTQ